MQKKQIAILVQQDIRYAEQAGGDHFQHQTQADYYQLSTYSKLSYQDINGLTVHLKWQDKADKNYSLEMRQTQGRMVFDPSEKKRVTYMSPAGALGLEIQTDHLQIVEVADKIQVVLKYRIYNQGHLIGNYDFQLIYQG